MPPKRKAEVATDGTAPVKAAKVVVKKIPKMLKAKILDLMQTVEVAIDKPTMKLFLADKYEFPDNEENLDKVWKAIKELKSEKKEVFGQVGELYHGGVNSPSYLALTPEDFKKDAEEKANRKPEEKWTCQHCKCTDYYCQIGDTYPGEFEGSTVTKYKCLNSCYNEFKVTVHGNKRIYQHGYNFEETTEVIV